MDDVECFVQSVAVVFGSGDSVGIAASEIEAFCVLKPAQRLSFIRAPSACISHTSG